MKTLAFCLAVGTVIWIHRRRYHRIYREHERVMSAARECFTGGLLR